MKFQNIKNLQTFTTISEIKVAIAAYKKSSKSIGLVPTMGALHQGHLALIERAKQQNNITICSIFVNPIQFNQLSDFEKYPNTLDADKMLLLTAGCDILFAPTVEQMYPFGLPELSINFGYQNTILEGRFRAGHFSGVGVVVSKLFNILQPTNAYFGQKDFQQCLVINQMVRELSSEVSIKIVEIVREADGLAMSSRNKRLNNQERMQATAIYQSLQMAESQLFTLNFEQIKRKAAEMLRNAGITMEYLDLVAFDTGILMYEPQRGTKYALCIAAFLGEIRLIDNVVVIT
ncbi:MAG: pantoate--beta-alanine ligase [Cytophagales bacterium]